MNNIIPQEFRKAVTALPEENSEHSRKLSYRFEEENCNQTHMYQPKTGELQRSGVLELPLISQSLKESPYE